MRVASAFGLVMRILLSLFASPVRNAARSARFADTGSFSARSMHPGSATRHFTPRSIRDDRVIIGQVERCGIRWGISPPGP